MTDQHPTAPATASVNIPLAVFLHGRGGDRPETAWVDALAGPGVRLFSHWPLAGVETTTAGLDDFGALCTTLSETAPGHALLVLGHPLTPEPAELEALAALGHGLPGVGAITAFNNMDPDLNPYAGLPAGTVSADVRARLVALLGDGRLLPVNDWPESLLLLTPEAVVALADPALDWADAPGRLRALGVQTTVADWIWVEAPDRDPAAESALDPHEERRPKPWGALSERLQAWLNLPADDPDTRLSARHLPRLGMHPVTLHVTHSWGGGVATWVHSMIEADPNGLHLQLRAEGPQSGQGAGQRLSLYLGNTLDASLASWWLQPAIQAVDTTHDQYREILDELCLRFGVSRIIVSSLVGHSLDALRTDLPTVQVLHDAFPAWPLLSLHPQDFDANLAVALEDPRAGALFPRQTLEDWQRIAEQYAESAESAIRVAPSEAARTVQALVEPNLDARSIGIIAHGLPPMPLVQPEPRPRADGRLRIVIPGRVHSGKGADLLEAALPGLLDVAQVTLLGTGKGGERFFGRGGVNVVLQYDREELAALLTAIGPDLALLPSTVPETFSYTLSEMQALGIPVLATNVGSFIERIRDGENGWRVDPNAEALLARVRALADDRPAIDEVRRHLQQHEPRRVAAMVEDYDALCPAKQRAPLRPRPQDRQLGVAEAQAASLGDQLRRARSRQAASQAELVNQRTLVEQRTRWAENEKRQRKAWVASLEGELAEARSERDAVLVQNADQERELRRRAELLEETRTTLEGRIDEILSSHSWKLTKPLRAGRRMIARFFLLKAWNPLRWPLLLSQTARNLSTVGLEGTFNRMQHFGAEQVAPRSERQAEPLPEPESIRLPAALPASDTPQVSIIIPAYNHLAHTAACLASIAETRCDSTIEVIVVDDASGDETPDQLADLPGLRFLRNDENLGFIGSCNRGAKAAKGEYVLFLNNDTQVTDGWLDALLDTFDQRPDAGLVGARLVYPDGTLQECGGIVFSDGSGWNYGRGDDPDRPEYQPLREVDYCSGACIMLRRGLFDSLGGFDRHYAPAYYEDTDLAFKVREAGLRVFVQPRATIVHFEGVTSGTDLASGAKRYQAVNREKFLERWREALKRQPAPIVDPNDAGEVRAARDHRLKGRVLMVDAYTPEPDQDSGSVRLVNLMRCLQDLGYGVSFFPDNRAWNGRYTRALQDLGVEAWYDPWLRSAEAYLEEHGRGLDFVIVSRHYVADRYLAPVRRLAPGARFLFDTVDLHYLREQRLADLENSATLRQVAKQTRRSELGVIKGADATLVVSPVERELLEKEVPGARIFVLSNIHEVSGSARDFDERSDLYFVGGYQHPPNIDAAEWFVGDIWPRVRERLPDVQFHLIGSKATDAVRALGDAEGVTFHGFVESLEPFLDGCRLAVAPLRYGAGVKGKVNQAMAHGQPVVATPAAVEGLGAIDGEEVLVAEDADAFADAVVRLYEDEATWRKLSAGGVRNVERHFSADAAKRDLEALLTALDTDP